MPSSFNSALGTVIAAAPPYRRIFDLKIIDTIHSSDPWLRDDGPAKPEYAFECEARFVKEPVHYQIGGTKPLS
jgi:hypothetical protein